MTIKKKVTMAVLTLVCGVMFLFSVEVFMTVNSGKLLPLMEKSIGRTTSEIEQYNPKLLEFIFTLIKIFSALLLSFTTGILILIYGPFKMNLKLASISVYAPLIMWLILAILIYSSQSSAPWMVWLVLLILVFVSLILTLTEKQKST